MILETLHNINRGDIVMRSAGPLKSLSTKSRRLEMKFEPIRGVACVRFSSCLRVFVLQLLIFSSSGVNSNALAQQGYPSRPIRVVVPFPPGGNVDTFGRVLFPYVEKELGQQLVVDNRGGANGILGSDIVAKATPDGYTLMATSFGFAVNPAITKNMPYDIATAFAPITDIALGAGYLMVGNPKVPVKTVKELIAFAKQQPGKVSYSTAGVGSGPPLAGALLA